MTKTDSEPDVLIIGAGPAGSCAAAKLAQAGITVAVIERQTFPRFAIGESLLPQCMDLLQDAGLLDAVESQDYQIKKGALFRRQDDACIINFEEQFHQSFNYTYQVPRAHFDQVLADQSARYGARFYFKHVVTSVDLASPRSTVSIKDPGGHTLIFKPRFILDASGYGHVLPRMLGLVKKSDFQLRSACFAHLDDDPGDAEYGKEYILIHINSREPDVWYWGIPFADNRTSFGLVAKQSFFSSLPEEPTDRLHAAIDSDPLIKQRFGQTEMVCEPGYMSGFAHSVNQMVGDQYAILGHSGEFLDPIFSSGVTVALKSAILASDALIKQFSGSDVDWQQEYSDELMRGVNTFKTYVKAWYDGSFQTVLFSDEKDAHWSSMVCSILAGYVWDRDNSLAVQHERGLQALTELCGIN